MMLKVKKPEPIPQTVFVLLPDSSSSESWIDSCSNFVVKMVIFEHIEMVANDERNNHIPSNIQI